MITVTAVSLLAALAQAAPCESLRTLSLPNTTITSAQLVAAGPYVAPAPGGLREAPSWRLLAPVVGAAVRLVVAAVMVPVVAAAVATEPVPLRRTRRRRRAGRWRGSRRRGPALPAHCRVAATLKPSADSVIDIEVWLPESAKAGTASSRRSATAAGPESISYGAMATAVEEGYATASTDTGHKGGNALFAIDHPEKLTDFAYRAVHEMTVQAKALITKYYDRGPRLSYWNGCSTGGRQGLMAAQRYPEDFDAILAGAPANYQTHLHAWDLAVSTPVLKDTAGAVPAAKLEMVNEGGAERVRRARRRGGRRAQRADEVHVRRRVAAVQGGLTRRTA